MTRYLQNLGAFVLGFFRLGTIRYKKRWGPWTFLPLYLIDYGSHVLTGGAVVSWSRWLHEHREQYRWANFVSRLLEHIDDDHGAEAGPALWGTTDCHVAVRVIATALWITLVMVWLR